MSEREKKPGDLLKNGYKIIAISYHAVLGFNEAEKQYATWQFDHNGNTINGHYYSAKSTDKFDPKELEKARDLAIGDFLLRK